MEVAVTSIVSIVMSVYNGEQYLAIAIESILNQTFKDFEFIIINDGSTDNSLSIMQKYAQGDDRIILIDRKNLGLTKSLNEGIAIARGEFIARMDADDISFPERLSEQVKFLTAHPEIDLIGCRAVVFSDNNKFIGFLPFAQDHIKLTSHPWNNIPLPHPTWIGRRDWFVRNIYRLPEVLRAEDQELLLRTYPYSQFACLDKVLLSYRQGSFNLKRTLLARRGLLLAQIRIFFHRKQFVYAVLAILITVIKIGVDLMAAIPGCEQLFFLRMKKHVS